MKTCAKTILKLRVGYLFYFQWCPFDVHGCSSPNSCRRRVLLCCVGHLAGWTVGAAQLSLSLAVCVVCQNMDEWNLSTFYRPRLVFLWEKLFQDIISLCFIAQPDSDILPVHSWEIIPQHCQSNKVGNEKSAALLYSSSLILKTLGSSAHWSVLRLLLFCHVS